MKLLVVLCLVAGAFVAPEPQPHPQHLQPQSYDNDQDTFNRYRFPFEQSDGAGRPVMWRGPDGVDYIIIHIHVADENGFLHEVHLGPGGGGGGGGGVPPGVLASLLG